MGQGGRAYFPVFECLGIKLLTADRNQKWREMLSCRGHVTWRVASPVASLPGHVWSKTGSGKVEAFRDLYSRLMRSKKLSLSSLYYELWKFGFWIVKGGSIFCVFKVKWRIDFCRTVQRVNTCCYTNALSSCFHLVTESVLKPSRFVSYGFRRV